MDANYRRWLFVLVILLVLIAGMTLAGSVYGVLRACSNILTLYFSAWLLQFFFTPAVDFLARHRLPRIAAVLYVYLVMALAVVVAGIAATPTIYRQGQDLASALGNSSTYDIIRHATNGIEQFLIQRLHVPPRDIKDFIDNYSVTFKNGAVNAGKKAQLLIQGYLKASTIETGANTVFGVFNTVTTAFVNAVIVLILAFYMTLDGPRLMRRVMGYFPPAIAEVIGNVQTIINRKFAGYLRGQIILAMAYGILTYIVAAWFGLPYRAFIAIFAGIMMLIPFVGTFAALVPPILLFVISSPSFQFSRFLLLLAVLIATQQVVINLLAPRVMGAAVGMHPLLVVLGLMLGIKVAGLWGAIFGVPVFGVALETADMIYRRFMSRRYGFSPVDMTGGTGPPDGRPMETHGSEQDRQSSPPAAPSATASRAGVALQAPSRPNDTIA